MKRIIGIFTAFLLPALPAFAAFDDFAQSYDSCKLDVNFDTANMELSDLPEKYQKMVETHAKEKVTKAFKGHCNNVAYSCEPGDYVTCNPCELLFYIEDLKDQYTDELIEEKCGHLKKTSKKTNTSSSTATASAANSDFDFAAASANDMDATVARSGLGNTPAPEPTTPEKSERQQQIEANIKKATTTPTKPAAEVIFEISAKYQREEP